MRYQLLARRLKKLHAVQLINDVPPITLGRHLMLRFLLQTLGLVYRKLALPRNRCFPHAFDASHQVRWWINDFFIVSNMIPCLLKRTLSRLAAILSILLKECLIVFGHRCRHRGRLVFLDLCELQWGSIVVSVQPLLLILVRRI